MNVIAKCPELSRFTPKPFGSNSKTFKICYPLPPHLRTMMYAVVVVA